MDWFYEQMETIRPVTDKDLYKMKNKSFTSGKSINVGDLIFYGRLLKDGKISLITFHMDELHTIYQIIDNADYSSIYPTMQLI
jgi:hypothetical protein